LLCCPLWSQCRAMAAADAARGPCGVFRFEERPKPKVAMVVMGRKRPWPTCPNPETGHEWSDDMREKTAQIMESLGTAGTLQLVASDDDLVDDPSVRKEMARLHGEGVHVVVVTQPTIGDGRLSPVISQAWGHRLVIWATPEEQKGEMISGNSLVGTHLYGATLRQLGRPFELVYGNLDWALAQRQLEDGIAVAFATRMLAQAKVCLIGYHAPGFQDLHADPFVMSKTFGTILQHVGFGEYGDRADALGEDRVKEDVAHVVGKFPFKEGPFGHSEEDLPFVCRHYLAMRDLCAEENFDAVAIRCWPELPTHAAWPYMGLARLASEGFPVACEGDVDGALGCLIGKFLGCGTIYLSDWLEHDADTLTLWHGGMAPFQLCEQVGTPLGPCISRHFNNKKPGCLDATIRADMNVTVFRFFVCDSKYHLIAMEGRTEKPTRHILGNNGLVRFPPSSGANLVEQFEEWVQKGFPHHVCVVEGHYKKRFLAFARATGVNFIGPK